MFCPYRESNPDSSVAQPSHNTDWDIPGCNRVQKSLPLVLMQSRINPIHTLPSHFFNTHFNIFLSCIRLAPSRDISVGIATGWTPAVRFPTRVRFFSLHSVQGPTPPPIQWVPEAFSPGIKRSRREAVHSPLSSAKNGGDIPLLPLYAFMALCTGTNLYFIRLGLFVVSFYQLFLIFVCNSLLCVLHASHIFLDSIAVKSINYEFYHYSIFPNHLLLSPYYIQIFFVKIKCWCKF
jgi:hypothetical protein